MIELASRFGAIGLLAIIIEGHPATLARFANLVKETLCGKRSEKPYDRPIQFPYQVSSRRVTREIASGTLREGCYGLGIYGHTVSVLLPKITYLLYVSSHSGCLVFLLCTIAIDVNVQHFSVSDQMYFKFSSDDTAIFLATCQLVT